LPDALWRKVIRKVPSLSLVLVQGHGADAPGAMTTGNDPFMLSAINSAIRAICG
jgi:hypothetical protein